MSASWPVSFHQPLTVWLSTRLPPSISCWIASVISSSPRPEGSIARAASKIAGREHVDADQRQVARRVLRLLDQPDDRCAVELGDAVVPRVGDRGEQDQRLGLGARGTPPTSSVIPSRSRLSPRYMTNGDRPRNSSAVSTACASPAGSVLGDVGDRGAEGRAVASRLADLVAGLRGDDDPDLGDPGVDQRLDPVEEHRLVGDRHELLGRGVGDRAQAGSGAAGEDQPLELFHRFEEASVRQGKRSPLNERAGGASQYVPPSLRWSQVATRTGSKWIATRFGAWAWSAAAASPSTDSMPSA